MTDLDRLCAQLARNTEMQGLTLLLATAPRCDACCRFATKAVGSDFYGPGAHACDFTGHVERAAEKIFGTSKSTSAEDLDTAKLARRFSALLARE